MDNQTLIPHDGVEKWAEWLDAQPKQTELNMDQIKAFFAISKSGEESFNSDPACWDLLTPGRGNGASFLYNRIEKFHTYKISAALAVAMGMMIDKPGEGVIYANYFQYKAYKMGKKELKFSDLVNIFPFGFFSDDTLRQAWDLQKYVIPGFPNMLDCIEAQKSIEIK